VKKATRINNSLLLTTVPPVNYRWDKTRPCSLSFLTPPGETQSPVLGVDESDQIFDSESGESRKIKGLCGPANH
jgi:hypothetical protein